MSRRVETLLAFMQGANFSPRPGIGARLGLLHVIPVLSGLTGQAY